MVQVSGGALTRTSSVAPSTKDQILLRGKQGRHNLSSRASCPAHFFDLHLRTEDSLNPNDAIASLMGGPSRSMERLLVDQKDLVSAGSLEAISPDPRQNGIPMSLDKRSMEKYPAL